MISRRRFTGALAAAAALVLARAQSASGDAARIGILDPGLPELFEAFFQGMRALGYVEGQNVSYVRRSGGGDPARIPQLALELAALKPDVVVTAAPSPIRAAIKATSTIPIVFVVGDAIAAGAVKSLALPGGNATGLSFLNTEISTKRLELLHEALPRIRRVAVLWDQTQTAPSATTNAARLLDLELQLLGVKDAEEFETAFKAAQSGHAEAIDVLASPYFNAHRKRLVELAAMYRLPAIYESSEYVQAGGLMSYGPSLADLFRRMAGYVDRILKGAKSGDLPVEQPTKFELWLNLKTAKALGLTIPPLLLGTADEVIE